MFLHAKYTGIYVGFHKSTFLHTGNLPILYVKIIAILQNPLHKLLLLRFLILETNSSFFWRSIPFLEHLAFYTLDYKLFACDSCMSSISQDMDICAGFQEWVKYLFYYIVKSQVVDVWGFVGQLLNFALIEWKPVENM